MKVSIIIPTYNRFDKMIIAMKSVLAQTWAEGEIEIFIINDGSTDERYYQYSYPDKIFPIHLIENSHEKFGYPCPGYVRNRGLALATGNYVAFLDDDDYWFPDKLNEQINLMLFQNTKMSCSDALVGKGAYQPGQKYLAYNGQFAKEYIFKKTGLDFFPLIWNKEYLKKNNSIICSSVILENSIVKKVGNFLEIPKDGSYQGLYEDYEYWKKCLELTNCIYDEKPLLYYDGSS